MGIDFPTVSTALDLAGGWWEVAIYLVTAGATTYFGGVIGVLVVGQAGTDNPAAQGQRLLKVAGGVLLAALTLAIIHGVGLSPRPRFWVVLSSEIVFLRVSAFLLLGVSLGVALYLMSKGDEAQRSDEWP